MSPRLADVALELFVCWDRRPLGHGVSGQRRQVPSSARYSSASASRASTKGRHRRGGRSDLAATRLDAHRVPPMAILGAPALLSSAADETSTALVVHDITGREIECGCVCA